MNPLWISKKNQFATDGQISAGFPEQVLQGFVSEQGRTPAQNTNKNKKKKHEKQKSVVDPDPH
jgi:hypothetical protein